MSAHNHYSAKPRQQWQPQVGETVEITDPVLRELGPAYRRGVVTSRRGYRGLIIDDRFAVSVEQARAVSTPEGTEG